MKREFYARDAAVVAKELLGKVLVHETREGITKGMILETEAYYGELDPGSHAYGGKRTPRNEVMWGPPGYAYVYFTYGMHHMLNVVTGRDGEARAVLIRAVEPIQGIELMRKRRGMVEIRNLTNGPGKVTQAFGITKKENGIDMVNSNLRIVRGNPDRHRDSPVKPLLPRYVASDSLDKEKTISLEIKNSASPDRFKIVCAPRIGIRNDPGEKLRFYIAGNPFVSNVRQT